MDALITAAALALEAGDALGALKRVGFREDAPALALRGIAMARLGDLVRAKAALKKAARGFGPREAVARARCIVAEAELALVSRDLSGSATALGQARGVLEAHGDRFNAAHARNIESRRLLLLGSLDTAEQVLDAVDPGPLPPSLAAVRELVKAGIAIRRLQTAPARDALRRATDAARDAGIAGLTAEVDSASRVLCEPAARLISRGEARLLLLDQVEALLCSGVMVIDACRNLVRQAGVMMPLATRPILFALVRALGEAWPEEVSRENLVARAFGGKRADESHRARLRVEIGRLRRELRPVAEVTATKRGFALAPRSRREIVVLAPPAEDAHAGLLALLADGEAWSSSALALALGTGPRTVQRALEQLTRDGKVQCYGRGRACRWMTSPVPGFPTSLLLPGPLPHA